MKRIVLCACIAAIATIWPSTARVAQASWVSDNCHDSTTGLAAQKRSDGRAYGETEDKEGYEWGGGCWNNDGRDNTPGQPDSNGEGSDCSGLVFKSWYLENQLHKTGWQKWGQLMNLHGPYSTYAFYAPVSDDPFKKLPNKNRDTTMFMDAFVKQGHIGLLDTSANPSSNTDWILEAFGDDEGTGIFERGYRYDSAYRAVARDGDGARAMTRRTVAWIAALTIAGGCRSGTLPSPSATAPSARASSIVATPGRSSSVGGTLPGIVLTADLSEPAAEWQLLMSIPYGASETALGLRFLPGDPPTLGRYRSPASFAVAADGSVWILDTAKARLARFAPDGRYIGQVTGLHYEKGLPLSRDVAIAGDRAYVLEGDSIHRGIRTTDFVQMFAPTVTTYQEREVVISTLFPSPEKVVGLVGGYADPLGEGPRGFAELDVPGSGEVELLPGVPVGSDRWIDLEATGDQDFAVSYHSGQSSSTQPFRVQIVTSLDGRGERLLGTVGPGIEAVFADAVGILVRLVAMEARTRSGARGTCGREPTRRR